MRPFVELVNPKLLLRIGLRYGDLIKIADGEKLEEYVDPYFDYPKLAKPLGTPEYQRDEVGIKTDVGRLLIRSIYGNTNLVSLPDIQGIPGLPQPEKEASNRIILDFDHVWSAEEKPEQFDLERIEDILTRLHKIARDAFWRITTVVVVLRGLSLRQRRRADPRQPASHPRLGTAGIATPKHHRMSISALLRAPFAPQTQKPCAARCTTLLQARSAHHAMLTDNKAPQPTVDNRQKPPSLHVQLNR